MSRSDAVKKMVEEMDRRSKWDSGMICQLLHDNVEACKALHKLGML